jgi:hypothetical protein
MRSDGLLGPTNFPQKVPLLSRPVATGDRGPHPRHAGGHIVYQWVGLAFLRSAWINLDLISILALGICGALLLIL